MRLFNNYFKVYDDRCIMEIANEMNLEPWELGEILIKISIKLFKEMSEDQILTFEENHEKFAIEHAQAMLIEKRRQISQQE